MKKPVISRTIPGLVVVSSSLVLAALPIFMVGGLAVQIRADLELTESLLGAAVTVGFVVGAVAALFGGRLADRIGPRTAVHLGAALSGLSLFGLGMLTYNWWHMVLFLSLAGLAVAIVDPGLAILVDRAIPQGSQGFAFGVKEASIPAATLAAGLAVPTVALTVGWRWAFALGAIPLVAILLLLPGVLASSQPTEHQAKSTAIPNHRRPEFRTMLIIAVAATMGTAAASGVGVFLTESAVAMGFDESGAGILLAIGSVAGIVARISSGVFADRTGGPQFGLISLMLAVGGVSIALGGTGATGFLVLGTVGTFAAGWAWTGIFFLSLIRISPGAPGAAAGVGTASLGFGNASGPLLFGLTAESVSFEAAWLGAGVVGLVAAGLMLVAMRLIPPVS